MTYLHDPNAYQLLIGRAESTAINVIVRLHCAKHKVQAHAAMEVAQLSFSLRH